MSDSPRSSASPRAPRRLLVGVALLACLLLAVIAPRAHALEIHLPDGRSVGIMPVGGAPRALTAAPQHAAPRASADTRSGAVNAHLPSGYAGLINQFLGDVSHDTQTGQSKNVFGVVAQYGMSAAPMLPPRGVYPVPFAGSDADTHRYPPDALRGNGTGGCVAPAQTAAGDPPYTYCLTDAQIQSEISRVIAANGLPRPSLSQMYLVVLPPGIDVCFAAGAEDPSMNACADKDFCGYHASFAGPAPPLYAVLPYADVGGCQSPASPNANPPADDQINVLAHEANEIATDPYGSGWLDANNPRQEVADKCAKQANGSPDLFGSAIGTSPFGGAFNQTINGHDYLIQEMFADVDGANPSFANSCEQAPGAGNTPPSSTAPGPLNHVNGGPVAQGASTYVIYWDPPADPTPFPTAAFTASTASAHPGQTVSFNASASSDSQGEALTYTWDFSDGSAPVTTAASTIGHAFTSSGPHTVSLTVTDASGYVSSPATQGVYVFRGPTASFTGPPAGIGAAQSAGFDASASADPDGTITQYAWSFGDGHTGAGARIAHVYLGAGPRTVTLTVTDSNGSTSSESVAVAVAPRPSPRILTLRSARVARAHARIELLTGRQVQCPAGIQGCTVTLTASVTQRITRIRHGRRRTVSHRVTIASARVGVSAGGRSTLILYLNQAGTRMLRQRHRLPASLRISVVTLAATGRSVTLRVGLVAPRAVVVRRHRASSRA